MLLVMNKRGRVLTGTTIIVCLLIALYMLFRPRDHFEILHSLAGQPSCSLIRGSGGSDGALYGTLQSFRTNSGCAIYALSTNGAFSELRSFAGCPDPFFSELVRGEDGSIYGIASERGSDLEYATIIYKIATNRAVSILHSFRPREYLTGFLVTHQESLLGTLAMPGPLPPTNGGGAIYEIAPNGAFDIIHQLVPFGEGINPRLLAQTRDGQLYGGTDFGPMFRIGPQREFAALKLRLKPSSLIVGRNQKAFGTTHDMIFEIAADDEVRILHTLDGQTEGTDAGDLVEANDGALYGTACTGGLDNAGTVFKYAHDSFAVVHAFSDRTEGRNPSGFFRSTDGSLYGVARPGIGGGRGVLFRLSSDGKFSVLLREWTGMPNIEDDKGNLYGRGVVKNSETVWEITASQQHKILHTFRKDEGLRGLALGSDGNVYGVFSAEHCTGGVFRYSTKAVGKPTHLNW